LLYTFEVQIVRLEEGEIMSGKGVPEGYHTITPYIVVPDVARAIEFYKKAFGATEKEVVKAHDGTVGHAELRIGDSIFMITGPQAKSPSAHPPGSHNTGLHIFVDDADAVFDHAVKAGAKVDLPVGDMFWGHRFGKLHDPFGHKWSISTHKHDVSEQKMKEGRAAFKHKTKS
jgi:PhnB protein